MSPINDYKKMEKNALKVFLSLAGTIYISAICYSFSSGNFLAGEMLAAVMIMISAVILWTSRSKA